MRPLQASDFIHFLMLFKRTYLSKFIISDVLLGLIFFNLTNSFREIIFRSLCIISLYLILPLRYKLTKVSFAETITVSKSEILR